MQITKNTKPIRGEATDADFTQRLARLLETMTEDQVAMVVAKADGIRARRGKECKRNAA